MFHTICRVKPEKVTNSKELGCMDISPQDDSKIIAIELAEILGVDDDHFTVKADKLNSFKAYHDDSHVIDLVPNTN